MRCRAMDMRMPWSFMRLETEYHAIPNMPMTESMAAIRPMTPRTMVAVRAGIMERSMASLHERMENGAVVTTCESVRCKATAIWSGGKCERTSTVTGPETMYGPMPCA